MNIMEKRERAKLKKKIIADIESLKSDIASLEKTTKPIAPDVAIGRLTRMEPIGSRNISEANLRSARSRLPKLQRALERIEEPDFGTCSECGEAIPVGRLLLMPESARCVHCAGA